MDKYDSSILGVNSVEFNEKKIHLSAVKSDSKIDSEYMDKIDRKSESIGALLSQPLEP
jgi:hypothetical protein